jgi:hypothetical protein
MTVIELINKLTALRYHGHGNDKIILCADAEGDNVIVGASYKPAGTGNGHDPGIYLSYIPL